MIQFREERKVEIAAMAKESEELRKATVAMFAEINNGMERLHSEHDELKREFNKKYSQGDDDDATYGSKKAAQGAVPIAAA